jgi:TonB family protein
MVTPLEVAVFDTLLESPLHRAGRPSRWGATVALALHLIVVAAFLRRPQPVQASRHIVIEPLPFPEDPHSLRPVEDGFRLPVTVCDCPLPPIPGPDPIPDIPTGNEPRVRAQGGSVGTPPFDPFYPGADEPLSINLVQELPVLLAASPPVYPSLLRAAGVQGRVELQVVVDTLGRVERGTFRVVHSDNPAFEAPAIESLRGARFRPARVFGRAVRVLVQIPVEFVLQR